MWSLTLAPELSFADGFEPAWLLSIYTIDSHIIMMAFNLIFLVPHHPPPHYYFLINLWFKTSDRPCDDWPNIRKNVAYFCPVSLLQVEWLAAKCQLSQLDEFLSEPVTNKLCEIPSLFLQATQMFIPKNAWNERKVWFIETTHPFHLRSVFLMPWFE